MAPLICLDVDTKSQSELEYILKATELIKRTLELPEDNAFLKSFEAFGRDTIAANFYDQIHKGD